MFKNRIFALFGVISLIVLLAVPNVLALPQSSTDMDGDHADWIGGTGGAANCFTDEGLADDETNPARADITQFCSHIDGNGLYLLFAWDDTRPQGGGTAANVLVDIDGDQTADYVIGNTIDTVGQTLEMDGLEISTCDDPSCSTTTLACSERLTPGQCTGSVAAIGDTMPDPFANPSRTACGGTNCATVDAFVEMYVPWSLLGGSPPASFLFMRYRSAPSATANAINDDSADVTGNGMACSLSGCYVSGPTAITLAAVGVDDARQPVALWVILAILTVFSIYSLARQGVCVPASMRKVVAEKGLSRR